MALCVLFLILAQVKAQAPSRTTRQSLWIRPDSTWTYLGDFPVIRSTVEALGGDSTVRIHFDTACTHVAVTGGGADSILLTFRVLPLRREQQFRVADLLEGAPPSQEMLWHQPPGGPQRASFRPSPFRLEGYFDRQMGAGSSVAGEAGGSMDLRLHGLLENGMQIDGALVDRALPFQPAGTSLELAQVERMYLRVRDSAWHVVGGDMEISRDGGGFLRYRAQIQGLGGGLRHVFSGGDSLTVRLATGLSKGDYRRVELRGIDGVQGPYRIEGERAFLQVVILAGSERVYVDGERKNRGLNADYTIDYNLGEIRFMPGCPIRGTSRIRVEYEAMAQRFPRWVSDMGIQLALGRGWVVGLDGYFHRDVVSRVGGADAPDVLEALRRGSAADGLWVLPTRKTVDGRNSGGYRLQTEHLDGSERTFYEYVEAGLEDSLFAPVFTYVGQGLGDYVLSQGTRNAQIYRYVSPRGGRSQGDYRAGYQIRQPESLGLLEARLARDHAGSSSRLVATYNMRAQRPASRSGSGYHHDFATEASHSQRVWSYGGGGLNVRGAARYVGDGFRGPKDFLPVDFFRAWGIDSGLDHSGLRDANLTIESRTRKGTVSVQGDALVQGARRGLGLREGVNLQMGRYDARGQASHRHLRDSGRGIQYQAGDLELGVRFGSLRTRLFFEGERRQAAGEGDYAWWETGAGIRFTDSVAQNHDLALSLREDVRVARWNFSPIARQLALDARGQGGRSGGAMARYRLHVGLPLALRVEGRSQDWLALAGDVSAELPLLARRIRLQAQSRVASEYAANLQYHYVRVPAGQGAFTWLDANANGEAELEEFVPALFADEGIYALQLVPSGPGQRSISGAHQLLLAFCPRRGGGDILPATPWFLRWDVKLDGQMSQQRAATGWGALLSLPSDLRDSGLLGLHLEGRAALWLNRGTWPFELRYQWRALRGKQRLPQGQDYSQNAGHSLRLATPPQAQLGGSIEAEMEDTRREVPYAVYDQLRLRKYSVLATLLFRRGVGMRLSAYAGYTQLEGGMDETSIWRFGTDGEFRLAERWRTGWMAEYGRMKGENLASNPLAYGMVGGFGSGNNLVGSLRLSYRLTTSLEAAFTYNLRNLGRGQWVQSGFLSLRGRWN